MTRHREPITIAIMGDVMLGRLMNVALRRYGPAYPWGDVLPLLRQADLRLANLECVIARSGRPWTRTFKVFHFRARPVALETLRLAGISAVSLANNHVLDYEEDALFETLDRLDQAGIARAGAGRDLAEASRPALIEAKGWRVGLVAFTDNEPVWAAAPEQPGINYLPIEVDRAPFDRVAAGIEAVRQQGADLVVLSLHWGPNMRARPPARFVAFAHAAVDAGVDGLWGHSAHIFQGVEVRQGRPILYDTGDFVDDYAVDPALRNDLSFLWLLHLDTVGLERVEMVPVAIDHCQVNLAQGADAELAIRLFLERTSGLNTPFQREGDRLVIPLRQARQMPSVA